MRKRWTGTICIMYTLAIRLDHHVFLAVCLKPRLREGGGEYRFTCSRKFSIYFFPPFPPWCCLDRLLERMAGLSVAH